MSNAPRKRRHSRTRERTHTQTTSNKRPGQRVALVVLVGLVAITAIAVFLLTGDDSERPENLAFNGAALPTFIAGEADSAIGAKAPIFITEYLDGEYAFIGGGGGPNDTAKLVMFVAHWCAVCQAEVPEVAAWVHDNGLPDGVEIVIVSTFADPDRDHYPPSTWLQDAGWEAPVAADSSDGEIVAQFGMPNVPAWVVLTDLNVVLARGTGPIAPAQLDQLVALAASSRPA